MNDDLKRKTGEAIKKAGEKVVEVERKLEKEAVHAGEAVVEAAVEAEEIIIRAEKRMVSLAKEFLRLEAAGGIVLVCAAIAALIIANTPLYGFYHYILNIVDFRIGFSDVDVSFDTEIKKSILHWINDGLMAIFFFLVGLEIKREVMAGELASRDKVLLPILAAIGGMAAPALIFWGLNRGDAAMLDGWAIPAATDIAFALGVMSLLGPRIPVSVKVLLTAIAIIDDIGAILIIAFFYAGEIWTSPLYLAGAALVTLFLLNRRNVTAKTPYFLASAVLWVAVFESGIHATLAGVVAAFFIPMRDKNNPEFSPLKNLEHAIHPWVAYAILPLFAFANAGVPFKGMAPDDVMNTVTLGIIGGLFLGKQLGIFSMLWLAIVTGLSPKPKGATWLQLYAVAALCGIGFTMSLFIGGLAYDSLDMQISVRIGVMVGSLLSAIAGYLLLLYSTRNNGSLEESDHDQQNAGNSSAG